MFCGAPQIQSTQNRESNAPPQSLSPIHLPTNHALFEEFIVNAKRKYIYIYHCILQSRKTLINQLDQLDGRRITTQVGYHVAGSDALYTRVSRSLLGPTTQHCRRSYSIPGPIGCYHKYTLYEVNGPRLYAYPLANLIF